VDGGVPRLVRVPFTIADDAVTATIPIEAARAPIGYYILFLMVDDIPSEGVVVRVRS
jgi:hypothetical protein